MKKQNIDNDDYELEDEYDFSTMTVLPKGRYAPERRAGKNIIILAPDLIQAFPTDEAVNEALRFLLRATQVSAGSA